MKICFLLVQKQFKELSHINNLLYGSKKEKQRYIFLILCLAFCVLMIGFYWIKNMLEVTSLFTTSKELLSYLIMPLIWVDIIMVFLSSLLKGSGIVFEDKNIEVEFSYPISVKKIALSKIIFVYVWELLLSLALLVIPLYQFEIFEFDILYCIVDIFQILLLPVIPLLIGLLVGYVLHKQLNKCFLSTSYMQSIIYVVLMIGFMCFMFFGFINIDFNTVLNKFFLYNNFFHFNGGILAHTPQSIFYMFIILGVCVLLLQYIFGTYKKKCLSLNCSTVKKSLVKVDYKKKSKFISLLLREVRRYFATPMYLLNTMLGIILVIIFTLYSFINPDNITKYLNTIASIYEVNNISVLCAFIISILIILSNVTYASISIEGENREILKAFPISFKYMVTAKYAFHLILTIPVIVICSVILGISFKMTLGEFILCIILPSTLSAFVGMLGLFFNLLFPNYDWKNVTYIVKQSPPAILTIIVSLIMTLGMFWVLLHTGKIIIQVSYLLTVPIIAVTVFIGYLLPKIKRW